jgi:hypothetical protein
MLLIALLAFGVAVTGFAWPLLVSKATPDHPAAHHPQRRRADQRRYIERAGHRRAPRTGRRRHRVAGRPDRRVGTLHPGAVTAYPALHG